MIGYLCRHGVATPSAMGKRGRGRGRKRRYSFGDVVALRTWAGLLKQGVSVKRVKEAAKHWKHCHDKLDQRPPPKRFLVTDGVKIYYRNEDDLIEDLTASGQLAFRFVVDIHRIQRDLEADITRLRGKLGARRTS
jgi:DNA-binding transcriptional MerR regulator